MCLRHVDRSASFADTEARRATVTAEVRHADGGVPYRGTACRSRSSVTVPGRKRWCLTGGVYAVSRTSSPSELWESRSVLRSGQLVRGIVLRVSVFGGWM